MSWSTYWTTLISAVVEDAAPTNVVLTFPTAKTSLGASDFTIAGFTISSASWVGSVLTLVLAETVLFDDVLVITFVKTGQTANVTNNCLWSSYWATQKAVEQAGFLSQGYGTLVNFNLGVFTDTNIPTNYDVDLFNPTLDIATQIDDWIATWIAAGMKYAILLCKSHEGFAIWDTSVSIAGHGVYGISASSWWVDAATSDVTKLFTDKCRAAGLKIGLYYSIIDYTWELWTGKDETTDAAAYVALTKTQLNELLSNYGAIDYLWIDGWGWHMPYTDGAGIPYDEIREYVGNIQKDCLLINNNPGHVPWSDVSDIREFEGWATVPAADNADPGEHVIQSMTSGAWLYRTGFADIYGVDRRDATSFYSSSDILTRKTLVNGRNCNMFIASSPNNTGAMNKWEKIAFLGANPSLLVYPYFATVETDDPDKVVITFIKSLAASVPAVTDFTLAGKTITNVAISGLTVTLTVSVAYALGDSIVVSYVKPVANMLKDTSNNEAASFANFPVTNNIVATNIEFLLTKVGTGLGVGVLHIETSATVTFTLGANAKFYSDAAGTLDESATWDCTAGTHRTRYIRCATGTATFTISKNKIKCFGADFYDGWEYAANAPSLSGDISLLTNLEMVRIGGANTFSGTANLLTKLTYLRVLGNSTIGGDISAMTALTYIALSNFNTVQADLAPLSAGMQHCSFGTSAGNIWLYSGGGNYSSFLNGASIVINCAVAGSGLSSAEVDQLIIDAAATKTVGRQLKITVTGTCEPPTAASAAAIAQIIADAGGSVTHN
jgi:alpha-L-fucosidase